MLKRSDKSFGDFNPPFRFLGGFFGFHFLLLLTNGRDQLAEEAS